MSRVLISGKTAVGLLGGLAHCCVQQGLGASTQAARASALANNTEHREQMTVGWQHSAPGDQRGKVQLVWLLVISPFLAAQHAAALGPARIGGAAKARGGTVPPPVLLPAGSLPFLLQLV